MMTKVCTCAILLLITTNGTATIRAENITSHQHQTLARRQIQIQLSPILLPKLPLQILLRPGRRQSKFLLHVIIYSDINDTWETPMTRTSTKYQTRRLNLGQLILCFILGTQTQHSLPCGFLVNLSMTCNLLLYQHFPCVASFGMFP